MKNAKKSFTFRRGITKSMTTDFKKQNQWFKWIYMYTCAFASCLSENEWKTIHDNSAELMTKQCPDIFHSPVCWVFNHTFMHAPTMRQRQHVKTGWKGVPDAQQKTEPLTERFSGSSSNLLLRRSSSAVPFGFGIILRNPSERLLLVIFSNLKTAFPTL